MSLLVKQVFSEIERMTLTEQIQVLKYLVEQIDKSVDPAAIPPQPKHKLTDFCGITTSVFGEDAQEWVSRTRREGDEHRERLLQGDS